MQPLLRLVREDLQVTALRPLTTPPYYATLPYCATLPYSAGSRCTAHYPPVLTTHFSLRATRLCEAKLDLRTQSMRGLCDLVS